MKKHSKSSQWSEPTLKRTKARGPVQRDAKEVLAEVLGKLTGKLTQRTSGPHDPEHVVCHEPNQDFGPKGFAA